MTSISFFELRAIAGAILILSTGLAHAQSDTAVADDAPELGTVTIIGVRADGLRPQTVEAGTFRGASVMDVPSTVNVVTREALELQSVEGLYDAVRNTAGVTRQQNGGETWDQLVIRGIAVQNRTNYLLNGSLPIMNFGQVSMEDKERVEVLKGASALYYGFTSPAGMVNFVTKRAGLAPVTSLGLRLDQYGSAQASADIGRRFGERQQYGVRINAAGGTLGSYLDGVGNGNRTFLSAALDWRVNQRLTLKADFEYDRRRVTEQIGVNLPAAVDGKITLPDPINPKNLVGPKWARFETESANAQVRADYALSDNWALTLEAGYARTNRTRTLPAFSFSDIVTGEGRIRGNQKQLTVDSSLMRAEVAGNVATGFITHDLIVGASRTDKSQDPIFQSLYSFSSQNLYRPRALGNATWSTGRALGAINSRDLGLYALDRMTLSPKWQVIAGLRYSNYSMTQAENSRYDATETTPMLAVIHKFTRNLSIYGSYSEGLEEGDIAPAGTDNSGERFAPGVSKQAELGTRWLVPNGTLLSAALFDIRRPGYYTNTDNVFTADGRQRYTGIELSAQGQLTRQLGWQTSAQWLNPRFQGINADYDGKLPENAARRTASAFLNYAVAAVPGLSVNGGAYYTGRRPVNDLDQGWLGGVTLFALGGRYETKLYGKRNSWQINIENVADKRYWAGAGTRLAAGAPRTVKLSYRLDL